MFFYSSILLGRLTSAVGYQPTLATEMGSFQERITSTRNGSITIIQERVHNHHSGTGP